MSEDVQEALQRILGILADLGVGIEQAGGDATEEIEKMKAVVESLSTVLEEKPRGLALKAESTPDTVSEHFQEIDRLMARFRTRQRQGSDTGT